MRKAAIMAIVATAGALMQAMAISLADASANISDAVANPALVGETVKQLAPADKTAYLAKVNAAIEKMPGSEAEKTAKFLAANKAAMKAMKGESREDTTAMLAEVFATVPPEALTAINESFATDLFSRSAGNVSDDTMKQIAVDTMKAIQARNSGNDNASVRDAFAVLMFLRASGGSPADLRKTLVDGLPTQEARELAATEWFPSALGEGREKTYEPMLAAAGRDSAPAIDDILALSHDSIMNTSLLANLAAPVAANGQPGSVFTDVFGDDRSKALPFSTVEMGLYTVPRTLNEDAKYNSRYRRGGGTKGSENAGESDDYPYQNGRSW